MDVVVREHICPDLAISPLNQVPRLCLEHRILVGDADKLQVVLTLTVCNIRQVRVALLTVLAHSKRVVHVVLLEEFLRIVVRVNVDFRESIVDSLLLIASRKSSLEERQKELQTVARLDFLDKFVDRDAGRGDRAEETLDDVLITVNIEKATDDARCATWVDALHVDFDRLELLVLVKVKDQVVDKVEAVADDDEWQLLSESLLLKKVFDTLWVI